MAPYVTNAGSFLVSTLFGLYILAVMLRFLFQLVRADFYNPISQALVAVTNPLLRPLRRCVPGYRGIDMAAVLLMLGLQLVETWLLLTMGNQPNGFAGMLILSIGQLLMTALYVFLFAVILQAILSWISPGAYNPMTQLLYSLTRPVLQPARRVMPPIGGMDFSPIAVIIALQLANMLLIAPVMDLGRGLL